MIGEMGFILVYPFKSYSFFLELRVSPSATKCFKASAEYD
jgi:hypothetical protein